MVLRLQVPKIVPKNETLVTKRHIEIPKGSGQKHFVLERSNLKNQIKTCHKKYEFSNSGYFYLLLFIKFSKKSVYHQIEKKVNVGLCSRVEAANVVYLLALYKQ